MHFKSSILSWRLFRLVVVVVVLDFSCCCEGAEEGGLGSPAPVGRDGVVVAVAISVVANRGVRCLAVPGELGELLFFPALLEKKK